MSLNILVCKNNKCSSKKLEHFIKKYINNSIFYFLPKLFAMAEPAIPHTNLDVNKS
jgi:hypothetical protein